MCGIAGYYGEGSKEVLQKMQQSLSHRGPDASGEFTDGLVGLAHRRLSILDLSDTGAQPMSSEDGHVTLVYNGEVFNCQELRQDLLVHRTFNGGSDTEVILKLYEEQGVASFSLLRGMYAFALYDARIDTLYLVRDSLGKKPLYWTRSSKGTVVFGSELKALKQHPEVTFELCKKAISQYLVFEYIPSPQTIYKDIFKLEPNTYLAFDGINLSKHQIKQSELSFEMKDNPVETFMSLMQDSVDKRMVADAPVGLFLSGGLDSSTVAYFAQKNKQEKIKTFSVGFEDKSFDEQDDAKLVAKHLGTDHHSLVLSTPDIKRIITSVPDILDEPMADSSIIPTTLVSEFASREVKVCLSGDGADELFHGYGTFLAHKYAPLYQHLPKSIQYSLKLASNIIPVSHEYMSLDFKIKRFLSGFEDVPAHRNSLWLSAFTPQEIHDLSDGALPVEEVFGWVDEIYSGKSNLKEGIQEDYLRGYLTEDILVKVDRASMHNSLEVRSPFLDERMVQFALSLEDTWKLRGTTGKYILKTAMDEHLPKSIVWKKKKGFNIPVGRLIIEDMREEFREAIVEGPLVAQGLFNRDKLEQLLEAHWQSKRDARKQIWSLFVLSKWLTRWQP